MPVTVEWHPEIPQTLLYTYTDPWKWDECLEAINLGRSWMREHPTQYIMTLHDMQTTHKLPSTIVSRAKQLIDHRPENTGLTVFIGGNQLQQTLFNVLLMWRPQLAESYLLVDSIEDAHFNLEQWLKDYQNIPKKS